MITAPPFKRKTLLRFSAMVNCNCCLYWLLSPLLSEWMNTVSASAAARATVLGGGEAVSAKVILWQRLLSQTLAQWRSTQREGEAMLCTLGHQTLPLSLQWQLYLLRLSFAWHIHNLDSDAVVHIQAWEADIQCSPMALALNTSMADLPGCCVVCSGVSKTQCGIITSTYVWIESSIGGLNSARVH